MTLSVKPYLRSISLKRDHVPSFDEYPFNIPAITSLESIEFHADVTFFVGENGSGKSTLVEAIALAIGFSPEGGTKNVRLETSATTSALHEYLKIVKGFAAPKDNYFLRAESFFNVATYLDSTGVMQAFDNRPIHARSHGEAFLAVLTQKLRGNGLYIFDEPEAALSPSRQLAALSTIHQLVNDGSQFIIATHSPILLAYPGARILMLDQEGMKDVAYEDTEHYLVTKDFLNNRERMLHHLFANEE
jgi:predicted ATPase